ncbi:unnamed protein product [Urochloa humidicola]
MEGGRSSAAALLLLALLLAAGSLAAVAQLDPPVGSRYMLVALHSAGRGTDAKVAMRIDGDVSLPGFANGKNEWFAVTGSEDLLPPGSRRSYRRVDLAGEGLVNMLASLVNTGAR